MVNKSFIIIILTILVLGVIFYLVSSCCNKVKEGFQEENENNDVVRYFADLDDDTDYDFMTSNISKIKQKDVEGGRLKMFKFDGRSAFLYLTMTDPTNVSMKLEMDPSDQQHKQ